MKVIGLKKNKVKETNEGLSFCQRVSHFFLSLVYCFTLGWGSRRRLEPQLLFYSESYLNDASIKHLLYVSTKRLIITSMNLSYYQNKMLNLTSQSIQAL